MQIQRNGNCILQILNKNDSIENIKKMKYILKLVLRIIVISLFIPLITGISSIKSQSDKTINKYAGNFINSIIKKDSSWLYLGQTPPGIIPERFPPDSLLGNSIWFWHGSPVFSPDGMELFMSRLYIGASINPLIYLMEYINGEWTAPDIPDFCGNYSGNSPSFTISGDTLFFISERPEHAVYFVNKNANAWSEAIEVNIPKPPQSYFGNAVSVAKNRTLYFDLSVSGADDLYKSEFINGQYTEAISLGTSINSSGIEFAPYIDPDEDYLIFSSIRDGGYGASDLYISTKGPDGNWTNAQNLGSVINSEYDDFGPWVSSDGLYFFFCTAKAGDEGYNPYWVDVRVLDPFIVSVEEIKKNKIDFQSYPNPFAISTSIEYEVLDQSNVTIQIIDQHGKLIMTLVDALKTPGINNVIWDGTDNCGKSVPSGVYSCIYKASSQVQSLKILFLK